MPKKINWEPIIKLAKTHYSNMGFKVTKELIENKLNISLSSNSLREQIRKAGLKVSPETLVRLRSEAATKQRTPKQIMTDAIIKNNFNTKGVNYCISCSGIPRKALLRRARTLGFKISDKEKHKIRKRASSLPRGRKKIVLPIVTPTYESNMTSIDILASYGVWNKNRERELREPQYECV